MLVNVADERQFPCSFKEHVLLCGACRQMFHRLIDLAVAEKSGGRVWLQVNSLWHVSEDCGANLFPAPPLSDSFGEALAELNNNCKMNSCPILAGDKIFLSAGKISQMELDALGNILVALTKIGAFLFLAVDGQVQVQVRVLFGAGC